jgi:hypothetical protein
MLQAPITAMRAQHATQWSTAVTVDDQATTGTIRPLLQLYMYTRRPLAAPRVTPPPCPAHHTPTLPPKHTALDADSERYGTTKKAQTQAGCVPL